MLCERSLFEVVVFAGGEPRLDRAGGLLGTVGEHVARAQQREGGFHDLAPGHWLVRQRGVGWHRDPGSGSGIAGVVDGELQQPGDRKPQRELVPQPPHSRLVGVLPRIQGPLVVLRRAPPPQ
jgi:hypothetical protein